MPSWSYDPVYPGDKEIVFRGPHPDLHLTLDYDDVDHELIRQFADRLLVTLNTHLGDWTGYAVEA